MSRVFAVYMALVLIVAMVGPGLAVYAAEGEADVASESAGELPAVEPVAEPELAPEALPVEEPVVAEEPLAEEPVVASESVAPEAPPIAEASIEAPVVTASFVTAAAVKAAASVTPVLVSGNPPLTDGGIRVPPVSGTYYYGDVVVNEPGVPDDFELIVTISPDGTTLSFTSNYLITRVIVKGGNDAYAYNYPGGTYGDTGLVSPLNDGGQTPEISHLDFYFAQVGALEVYKFEDTSEDGIWGAGEAMLQGWAFTLYDSDDTEIGSGFTDVYGKLAFSGLAPGAYYVVETLQGGWINTTPLTQNVTVVAAQTAELWFGNIPEVLPPDTGELLIHKFEDTNENGVHDAGEAMLEDWAFTLYDGEAAEINSGLTDANGGLLFTELAIGMYSVTETLQDGWVNTTPLTQGAEVVANQTTELWFGNIPEVTPPENGGLLIHKFEDTNENGVWDTGEAMLEDWEFMVTLETPPLEGVSASAVMLIGSGLTDADGELGFTDLVPGEYHITETLQDGWTNTTPLTQIVNVVAGQTAEVWFGNVEEFLPFTELDLAILKLADKETANQGELITYTLTYWNLGDLAAENFTIVDDYDERYVTIVNAAGGTVAGGKITWTLAGPLAKADGMKTITYTVRVIADMPAGTTNIDNVVVISHPLDRNLANNTAAERVIVRVVDEPFLPFTGGEYLLLLGFAVAAAALGLLLRPRTDNAV